MTVHVHIRATNKMYIIKNLTKKTNADRVRSKTDEELAVFLDHISKGCDNCPKRRYCLFETEEDNCRDAFLKWLKQEAEE